MKLKYYLRGLGTGKLFATIILFVSYSYKMSDSQIKKEAEKLGMVYASGESQTTSSIKSDKVSSSVDEELDKTSETQTSTQELTTPQETSTEHTTTEEQTTAPETTTEATTEAPTTTVGNIEKCEITVTGATTSYDVAYALQAAGIVDDAEKFNDYLCENGYDRRIQNGKYTITSEMSYKEIGELICTRNY